MVLFTSTIVYFDGFYLHPHSCTFIYIHTCVVWWFLFISTLVYFDGFIYIHNCVLWWFLFTSTLVYFDGFYLHPHLCSLMVFIYIHTRVLWWFYLHPQLCTLMVFIYIHTCVVWWFLFTSTLVYFDGFYLQHFNFQCHLTHVFTLNSKKLERIILH